MSLSEQSLRLLTDFSTELVGKNLDRVISQNPDSKSLTHDLEYHLPDNMQMKLRRRYESNGWKQIHFTPNQLGGTSVHLEG
jgi:hypothetical protein